MRTTLTIEDDIADFLREQSKIQDKPLEKVLNETLRRGMSTNPNQEAKSEFRVTPTKGGFAPGIDPLRLKAVLSELDDEAFQKKLRR